MQAGTSYPKLVPRAFSPSQGKGPGNEVEVTPSINSAVAIYTPDRSRLLKVASILHVFINVKDVSTFIAHLLNFRVYFVLFCIACMRQESATP